MEVKESWMNKLKEKLADYAEPTPASGWEQLEEELKPPLLVEKKIYPYRKWIIAVAAVILLAVVSSVSLYFLGTPAADEIRHIQTPALASTPDMLPKVQQPDVQGVSIDPVRRPTARKDRLAKAERHITEHKAVVEQPVEIGEPATGENKTDEVITEAQPVEGAQPTQVQSKNTEQPRGEGSHRPSGRDKYHLPAEKPSSQKGTWSVGLSVGNSGGTSAAEPGWNAQSSMSRVNMSDVSNGLMEIPDDQSLVFEGGVPYLLQSQQVVDIKHHQPISFGLSVRKALTKGFSVETGLTYTLLSSDAELANDNRQIEQKLHYIGIPLRANWNFLDKKLVTLYVSGGGMAEKCVYGKLGSEKETVKPFQLSVSGAVGAQLNATKRVGIYVEPGVAYYFDDGSSVQTIRKENPFNFNIQAGLRLTY